MHCLLYINSYLILLLLLLFASIDSARSFYSFCTNSYSLLCRHFKMYAKFLLRPKPDYTARKLRCNVGLL